jgi:hypothetical protein
MRKQFFMMAIFISIMFSSCFRAYEPEIDKTQASLVVDGLITDQPATYHVSLYYSNSFTGAKEYIAAESAKITITDNIGNLYALAGGSNGVYYTDSTKFTGVPGRSYTLHILLSGQQYESAPQLLPISETTDTLYGEYTTREVLMADAYGGYFTFTENVLQICMNFKSRNDSIQGIRLTPTFVNEDLLTTISTTTFCCTIVSQDDSRAVNITDEANQLKVSEINHHVVGSFVLDEDPHLYLHIVSISRYLLNSASYKYYKEIKTQLTAEGKLFDPITSQLSGNIICKSDPSRCVFGFFEASGLTNCSYAIQPNYTKVNKVKLRAPFPLSECVTIDFNLPDSLQKKLPGWWIY